MQTYIYTVSPGKTGDESMIRVYRVKKNTPEIMGEVRQGFRTPMQAVSDLITDRERLRFGPDEIEAERRAVYTPDRTRAEFPSGFSCSVAYWRANKGHYRLIQV